MQLADEADRDAVEQHAGAAAQVHRRVLGSFELGHARRQQRLDIAFDVEEVDRARRGAPLLLLGIAPGQRGNPHRLVEAGDRGLAVDHTGVILRNTRPSSNTRTRAALRSVLNLSTLSRLPSSELRITLSWLAIGFSSLIGSALPA